MDTSSAEAGLRRRIVAIATLITAAAVLHHVDHVIRGDIVVAHNLDPELNHSGWPFQDQVTPFTASLAVYLLLIGGIVFTLRGRLLAGYWLATTVLLAAIILLVHFVPGPATETLGVIYRTHNRGGNPVAGAFAVLDVAVIIAGLVALGTQAIRARQISRPS
ncbi:MAG: hypothetical protein M3198_10840 [Actinomycetota bacterium]|nr:hypothetical protein [Actinomycetota bacterium]